MSETLATRELACRFADLFRDPHMTVVEACARLGIARKSFYRWLAHAEAGRAEYMTFAAVVIRARAAQAAQLEHQGHEYARQANGPSVRWIQWLLETRHPSVYSRTQSLSRAVRNDGPDVWKPRPLSEETANWMRLHVLGIGAAPSVEEHTELNDPDTPARARWDESG